MRRRPALAAAALAAGLAGGVVVAAAAQPVTWNFAQADIPAAQGPGRGGAGVVVAVVDTWVDFTHPDFGGRVFDEAYCVGQNGSCLDRKYAPDQCVHGTHVAGTVASETYGVAPAARILAVQVLSYDPANGECSGSTADVAAGIRWAATHGAGVINLSLGDLVPGLFQSAPVTNAIQAAAQAGAVVVVAAGNSTLPLTDNYGTDAVLVAATGPGGGLASYSDRNGSVALAAPGGDDGAAGLAACTSSDCVMSTEPHDHFGLLEGTSMAAPHVSGTAALLLAQVPGRGRVSVIQALESTARPLAGAGHGELDASAALALDAGSAPGPTTRPAAASPAPARSSPGTLPTVPTAGLGPARPATTAPRASPAQPPARSAATRRSAKSQNPSGAAAPGSKHNNTGDEAAAGVIAGLLLAAVAGGLIRYLGRRRLS